MKHICARSFGFFPQSAPRRHVIHVSIFQSQIVAFFHHLKLGKKEVKSSCQFKKFHMSKSRSQSSHMYILFFIINQTFALQDSFLNCLKSVNLENFKFLMVVCSKTDSKLTVGF